MALLLLGISLNVTAQTRGNQPSPSLQLNIPALEAPAVAASPEAGRLAEFMSVLAGYQPGQALAAGIAIPLAYSARNHGQWNNAGDTLYIWRMSIHAEGAGASGINLLSQMEACAYTEEMPLPDNLALYVYRPGDEINAVNIARGEDFRRKVLVSPVVPGEELIVELSVPKSLAHCRDEFLQTESLIWLPPDDKNMGSSGDCQVNINCAEGDNWQDQKRGVARMLMRVGSNYFWCSGSLVNNTAQDASPLFLSADHCGRDASATDMLYWQFYFNFERPGCSEQGMPPHHMVYGADLLSKGPLSGGSDFKLLYLHNPPPAAWRPYFNGWDRSLMAPQSGAGIHHPSGDLKKISTYLTPLTAATPLVSGELMAAGSAWRVLWRPTANGYGVSEGGSSGSPLFNQNGLIVGTLTGGSSSCTNPTNPDYYGNMNFHWNKNGSLPQQQLQPFLDPLASGQLSLGGLDPVQQSLASPGFLSARLQTQESVLIEWRPPGQGPNQQTWYNNASQITHLGWSSPERAVVFEAASMGLNYPLVVSRLAHSFIEHSSQPWPSNQFQFRVYDTNGQDLLYQSPMLTAINQQQIIHQLPSPLVFHNYFYVSVRPQHTSGHPSSAMQRVNFGRGSSFNGSAGNWNPYDSTADELSYAYHTSVFINTSKENAQESGTLRVTGEASAADPLPVIKRQMALISGPLSPDAYRIYRNQELLAELPASGNTTYTDQPLPEETWMNYQVTALYGDMESEASEPVWLLKGSDCESPVSQWPWTENFAQDFDQECWLHPDQNGESAWILSPSLNWQDENLMPQHGDQFWLALFDEPAPEGEYRQAWLILPEMHLTSAPGLALRIDFAGHYHDIPRKGELQLWAATDQGSFQQIWSAHSHTGFTGQPAAGNSLLWHRAVIPLMQFAGAESLRLALQYRGEEEGFMAVDRVEVIPAQSLSRQISIQVMPDYAGMAVGQGTYLAGQSVQLSAFPNISNGFDAWIQAGSILSRQREYRFEMPDANLSLTARFFTDLTGLDDKKELQGYFSLYPNPGSDIVWIQSHAGAIRMSIGLFDLQGRKIKNFEFQHIQKGESLSLPVSDLAAGLYLIRIKSPDHTGTFRWIKND